MAALALNSPRGRDAELAPRTIVKNTFIELPDGIGPSLGGHGLRRQNSDSVLEKLGSRGGLLGRSELVRGGAAAEAGACGGGADPDARDAVRAKDHGLGNSAGSPPRLRAQEAEWWLGQELKSGSAVQPLSSHSTCSTDQSSDNHSCDDPQTNGLAAHSSDNSSSHGTEGGSEVGDLDRLGKGTAAAAAAAAGPAEQVFCWRGPVAREVRWADIGDDDDAKWEAEAMEALAARAVGPPRPATYSGPVLGGTVPIGAEAYRQAYLVASAARDAHQASLQSGSETVDHLFIQWGAEEGFGEWGEPADYAAWYCHYCGMRKFDACGNFCAYCGMRFE